MPEKFDRWGNLLVVGQTVDFAVSKGEMRKGTVKKICPEKVLIEYPYFKSHPATKYVYPSAIIVRVNGQAA